MNKRLISILIAALLSLNLVIPALGVASLSNFDRVRTYDDRFSDLSPGLWYYDSVRNAYEYGIMDGRSAGLFNPSGRLTIAESIKLAVCLHQDYYAGVADFSNGTPWYKPYVDYALSHDIITDKYKNYNAVATRSDFAVIITGAMPNEALTPINSIPDGAIPDVDEGYSYGKAVYRLYRAGILTGYEKNGAFYPGRSLSRAEAAAIIERIVDTDSRRTLALATPMTAEQIYKMASPCVFYIEIFDDSGILLKTGSGFFITESGVGVTNYHVLVGAVSAKITTDDGKVFDITGIYDYDWKRDIALVKIDGKGFNHLKIGDSQDIQTGETVYSLGSPLGMQSTFSKGIISQASRDVDGSDYIQIDAAISPGSSGGVLLDVFGRAIGITSASMVEAQNLNFAIPIATLTELSNVDHVPLASILIKAEYYKDYYPAPDFGAYFGIEVFFSDPSGPRNFSYLLSELPDDADAAIDEYLHIVEQNQFTLFSQREGEDGGKILMYHNSNTGVIMTLSRETINNNECFSISLV